MAANDEIGGSQTRHAQLTALLLCGILPPALYFAARSAWFGITLAPDLPRTDQWAVVIDYFAYLDGRFSFGDLFRAHLEHRVATTKILLFADAMMFSMRGVFPIIVIYAALALIALLASRITLANHRWPSIALAALILLGLVWGTSQNQLLTRPFVLCIALVHLFALLCYVALARGLASERNDRRVLWLVIACLCNGLAIVSLASGFLVGFAAVALAIWLKRIDRLIAAFAGMHLVFVVMYFWSFPIAQTLSHYKQDSIYAHIEFVAKFLAESLAGGTPYQTGLGFAMMLVFIAACGTATWRTGVRGSPMDRGAAVFLTLAAFVVSEAALASVGRVGRPAPHYSTPSMVFMLAMLGYAWRSAAGSKREWICQVAIMGATCVAIFLLNAPRYDRAWRLYLDDMQRTSDFLVSGGAPRDIMRAQLVMTQGITPEPFEQIIARMKALRLGPWSPGRPLKNSPDT